MVTRRRHRGPASILPLLPWLAGLLLAQGVASQALNEAALAARLTSIARLAQPSPMVAIPAGWFLMGTARKDDDPYGMETQFDDTELPQRRIWLDAYQM